MENWNDGKFYLPDCDDIYEVLLSPISQVPTDCYYDGKGFLLKGEYQNVRYWRKRVKDLPKRYGAI